MPWAPRLALHTHLVRVVANVEEFNDFGPRAPAINMSRGLSLLLDVLAGRFLVALIQYG